MSVIERIPIPDRSAWLALRRRDITGSVGGALFGVHPYLTPYSLHMVKAGLVADDIEETPALRRGKLLEPVAVQMIREDYPDITLDEYPVGYYYRDPEHRIGATPDLLATDAKGRRGVVQIKSVEPSIFRRDWRGDDGSIDPPLWIVIQAIIEAHLTGAEWAAVAPMRVSFGIEIDLIPIPLHAGIIDRLKHEVAEFWARVDSGTPPDPDYGRDGALIARLYPKEAALKTVTFTDDNYLPAILQERSAIKARMKLDDARCDEIAAEVKQKMGDAELGLAKGFQIKWKTEVRNFKAKPAYSTSSRVLRITERATP